MTDKSATPLTDVLKLDERGAAGLMEDYDALCRTLERRVAALEAGLRKLAHAPEYNGSLCPDPDDCPNCYARALLKEAK